MNRPIRIATRKSELAVVQAKSVAKQLAPHATELVLLSTQGDRQTDHPLAAQGGNKGWFVKELEDALLHHKADLAVHCIKDMPIVGPKGLITPIILKRDYPLDVLVGFEDPLDLPDGAIIGTCSLRRSTQWLKAHPHTKTQPIRGNLQTRLKKWQEGPYDALLLAEAGLKRLGLDQSLPHCVLPADCILPAAGQGALGLQIRADDHSLLSLLKPLHCIQTATCVEAERGLIKRLQAGCQSPVAAFASIDPNGSLTLRGQVGPDMQACHSGPLSEPQSLANAVFLDLKAQGALPYLEAWS